MMIKKISYGVQMWQPEISSDIAVIQLYNDSACKELKTNEVRSKCALYNQCGSQKRYGIIRFKLTNKGLLQWVKLINLVTRQRSYTKRNLSTYWKNSTLCFLSVLPSNSHSAILTSNLTYSFGRYYPMPRTKGSKNRVTASPTSMHRLQSCRKTRQCSKKGFPRLSPISKS